jgi:thioredoxin-related protein
MKMKIMTALVILGGLAGSLQAELEWHSDFEKGKKAAAKSGKTLLVNFTGSDWCHWCVQLKKEVFDQEAFAAAPESYELVELDFPQAEDLITPEQRGKNEALAQKLGVDGFPSVILFDAEGRPFARTGYQAGGPEAYLKHLEEISQPYQALQAAEGEGRKDALVAFLRTLAGENVEANFGAELKELKKLDPEDETGYLAEMTALKALAEFEAGVEESLSAGDFESVLEQVDTFLAEHNPQGEDRQHVVMGRVMVFVEQGDKEKAFAEIDKMAAFAPESEFSQNVKEIKASITEHLEMRAEMEKEAEAAEATEPEEPTVVEEAAAAEETEEVAEEQGKNPPPVVE